MVVDNHSSYPTPTTMILGPLDRRNGSELHVVVSSLYLRCVETAIQVPVKENTESGWIPRK